MSALEKNPDTDEILLKRTGQGDDVAFVQLFERHRDAIFRFACRMLGSQQHAEDVTHDCFLGLIRNPSRFNPHRASLRTYLYAAARNLALKRLRHLGIESALANPHSSKNTSFPDEPLHSLLAQELSGEVRKAIARMPPPQREVIVLFEYEEQSLAEIAAIVGTDVGTVKWRLHQARGWLRRELAPYLNCGAGKRRENSSHEG